MNANKNPKNALKHKTLTNNSVRCVGFRIVMIIMESTPTTCDNAVTTIFFCVCVCGSCCCGVDANAKQPNWNKCWMYTNTLNNFCALIAAN